MFRMICSLAVLCLLLKALMLHITQGSTACESGWFGTNCQYRCLCTGSQCDSSGQCLFSSKCKPGYFGPACQYGDIAQLPSLTSESPVWLRDGDDATCNPSQDLQSVSLRFNKGLSFSWFRICVSKPDALDSFDVKLNNDVTCSNMKSSRVDDTIKDIYCSMNMPVKSLILSGPGVPFLCSVYVNFGRNIAPRLPIGHSSLNMHGELPTVPLTNETSLYRNAASSIDMCPRQEKLQSQFNHSFTTPQFVTTLLWTKRHDENASGFSFQMYDAVGHLLNYFMLDKNDFYIYIETPQPASMVSISAKPNELLNLCELFIFGETFCPESTFGLDCGSLCNCSDGRKTCLPSTGACANPCPDGFYGWKCSVPCPDVCKSGICKPRHGDCINQPLTLNVLKTNVRRSPNDSNASICAPGFYGQRCSKHCDVKCGNKCHPVSGHCTQCQTGKFGANCTEKCNNVCRDLVCEPDTGICMDCISTRYGNYCEELCPESCYLRECNRTTGQCNSCAAGFKGPNCTRVPWNVTLFIVLLFLIPSVIACFFCCEVLSDEDAEDLDKDSMSTEISGQPSTSAV